MIVSSSGIKQFFSPGIRSTGIAATGTEKLYLKLSKFRHPFSLQTEPASRSDLGSIDGGELRKMLLPKAPLLLGTSLRPGHSGRIIPSD
jgi:hypothetical protein